MPLPARCFDAVRNRRFAPGDTHIHAGRRIRHVVRRFPRGFVHDTFGRFVAFPPLAVVAVPDTDELIALFGEPLFRPALARTEFHTGAHRAVSLS